MKTDKTEAPRFLLSLITLTCPGDKYMVYVEELIFDANRQEYYYSDRKGKHIRAFKTIQKAENYAAKFQREYPDSKYETLLSNSC